MSKFNLDIKKVKKSEVYTLDFKGKDVNHIVINTIRRVCYNNIPIFTYDPKKIKITKNTSVFNNDYLRLRLSNLPIDIENNVDNLELSDQIKNMEEEDENENFLSNKNSITMYCKEKNNSQNLLNVTTDMCTFYKDGEVIDNPYKVPLLLCKLNSTQELIFSATTKIGIGSKNGIYTPCSFYFEKINDNNFHVKIESTSQLNEHDIILRGCMYIIKKMKRIMNNLIQKNFTKSMKGEIILKDEDHTMGNLITYGIQSHDNIEFCGYKLNHLLIKEVNITYITDGAKSINEIIKDSMSNQIKLYEYILSNLKKLK